jgi:hypothetical protein
MVFLHRHAVQYYIAELERFCQDVNRALELGKGNITAGQVTRARDAAARIWSMTLELVVHVENINEHLKSENSLLNLMSQKKLLAGASEQLLEDEAFVLFIAEVNRTKGALVLAQERLSQSVPNLVDTVKNAKELLLTDGPTAAQKMRAAGDSAIQVIADLNSYAHLSATLGKALHRYYWHIETLKNALVHEESQLQAFERNLRSWF